MKCIHGNGTLRMTTLSQGALIDKTENMVYTKQSEPNWNLTMKIKRILCFIVAHLVCPCV